MRIFVVKRGDTLYSIAKRFGVTTERLSYINALSDPNRLSVGQTLVIPGDSFPQGEIEVNGYAYPNISDAVLNEALPYMTFLCPFSWQMDASGGITPIDDKRIISRAYETATAPMLTLTNISPSGGFSSDIAHAIFTDETVQATLIENILSALRSRGYYGVNLNIEYVYPFDREGYNAFLRRLSETLHPKGYYLSSAIAPKTSDEQYGLLYTAHDYEAHGKYCDRVIIMTYEWGYTYSAPQAVSPVNRIRSVLDYAVTKIPSGKILLGFSNYGYNWTLPWQQGKAATVISNTAAVNLAAANFAQIKFDEKAQAPFFNYTDPSGVRHEVWFEDARSVRARLALVPEYGLAGISYWTINYANRAGFAVLESMYGTQKII
ncbi:MAG: glycosyl hydrolase family 18 protein [Oscillospiraceae bacterium]|nr:glycosyl hydrolase family 18 protein [Oscillospiraceae bacterium]